jgi:hypothetical protein
MNMKTSRLLLACALFLLALITVVGAAAQTGATYFVSDVDGSGFPLVQFRLRAVDLDNKVVGGLDAPNVLSVYENGQQAGDVQVTPSTDGPINYVFVIDQGRVSNYSQFQLSNVRQVFSTLISGGYFVDGRDTVSVLGRQNITSDQTVTLLPATQSGSDLTTWAANFNFGRSSGNTKGLLGVEDGVEEIRSLSLIPGSETDVIIFLTRYIEDPSASVAPTSAQNTADMAREASISVYVLQTDFNQYRKDALQVLADGTSGQHAGLTRSNFLGQITSIYQLIDSQRSYYTVGYRSPIAESDHREITINSPVRPDAGVYGSYEIALEPPSVTITQPIANSTIRREAPPESEETQPLVDTTRIPVIAVIDWIDGYPRQVVAAELYVNGTLEQSPEPVLDQAEIEFQWDLSDITSAGLNSVTLEVRIEDELGMKADGQSTVNVDVIPPEEGSGFAFTPLVASLSVVSICIGGVVILAVLAGVVLVIKRLTSSQKGDDEEVVESLATIVGDEIKGISLATLTLLEGPSGMKDEVFKITTLRTRIGRETSRTDITFYPDDASSLSRLHCVIQLDDDNVFRLIDQSSSAGTHLNGRKIQPEVAVDLDEGDEIVLGNLAQKGIKLRFNYMAEDGAMPLSGTADDRTHLLSEDDIQNWDDELNNSPEG